MPAPFDPARARSFAALLARPRECGTPEERWAAATIRDAFRDAGLETTEEHFHFRPSGDLVTRLLLLLGAAGLALVWAGARWEGWLAAAGLAALAAAAAIGPAAATAILLARARESREGETPRHGWVAASNVIGSAPGPADGPLLVFVAHFDSKSQSLPIVVRVALFALLGIASLLGTALALARLSIASVPLPLVDAAFAVAAVATLPLLALRTGNESPGALDNACGAGTLVELARLWRSSEVSWKARAIFLAPSAEEHGLVGSRLWVRRHLGRLRGEGRLWILNLDGCAATGGRLLVLPARPPKSAGRDPATALLEAASERRVPAWAIPFAVGLLADHVPFVEAGLSCASLLSTGRGTRRIHGKGDAAELLEDAGFEAAGRVVIGAVERLISG
jgi:hypothetical protein